MYNTDTDEVRVVVIMPSAEWGGAGAGILGAGVAHGYLHGLPSTCCETTGMSQEGAFKIGNSAFGSNLPPRQVMGEEDAGTQDRLISQHDEAAAVPPLLHALPTLVASQ